MLTDELLIYFFNNILHSDKLKFLSNKKYIRNYHILLQNIIVTNLLSITEHTKINQL